MTFYEAQIEAEDAALKPPKSAIPSSREPSRARQSQDLFEVPKSKTKSSTHLCITIRLGGRVAELPAGSKRRRGSGAGRRAGR